MMTRAHQDQAAGLRRIMVASKSRVVSIISAEGSQDQPRMLTNLGASMSDEGLDVLVIHASKDSSEKRYALDQSPSLFDVVNESRLFTEVITDSKRGFHVSKLMQKNQFNISLDSAECEKTNQLFEEIAHQYEVLLVDATLNQDNLLPLKILNDGEIIIQLTRQPDSITQAYTLIKKICSELGRRSFGVIVNHATEAQAQVVFNNISKAAKCFMKIELEFFGTIPNDEHLNRAAKLGRSVGDAFPAAHATEAFKRIAQRLAYTQDRHLAASA